MIRHDKEYRNDTLVISTAEDIDSLLALEGEWNGLVNECGDSSLFCQWEWVCQCCRCFSRDEELSVLLARDSQGALHGIAPFLLRRRHVITRRVFLEFVGQRFSYHLDVICQEERRSLVCKAIAEHIFENRDQWDVIDIMHLSEDTPLREHLTRYAKTVRYVWRQESYDPCKVVSLGHNFDGYMSSLPKPMSKKLKYYQRSMQRDFDVELCLAEDDKTLTVFWESFLELHIKRFGTKGAYTVLSDSDFQGFYRAMAQAAYREGNLRLVALKLDGQIAAVLFGIVCNETFNFLNIGYRKFSKYSLGLVVPVLCIEMAIEQGLGRFDFLGGGGDYKEKLGGLAEDGLRLSVWRRSALLENYGRRALDVVWKRLRKIQPNGRGQRA